MDQLCYWELEDGKLVPHCFCDTHKNPFPCKPRLESLKKHKGPIDKQDVIRQFDNYRLSDDWPKFKLPKLRFDGFPCLMGKCAKLFPNFSSLMKHLVCFSDPDLFFYIFLTRISHNRATNTKMMKVLMTHSLLYGKITGPPTPTSLKRPLKIGSMTSSSR